MPLRSHAIVLALEALIVAAIVGEPDPPRIVLPAVYMLGLFTAPAGAFACALMLLLAAANPDVHAFRVALAIGAAGGLAACLAFIALVLAIGMPWHAAPRTMYAIAFFAGWAAAVPCAAIHVRSRALDGTR